MNIRLAEIPHAFQLPRIDWPVVRRWIEQTVPPAELPAAWTQVVMQWLETLEGALGEGYRCIRSPSLILFVPEDFEQAVSLFDLAESGLRETKALLGDLVHNSEQRPLPVLVFADQDSYARYVSPYDPEFETVRSAGVCFNSEWDYVHVAIRPARYDEIQRTVLHEISHACLAGRRLPLWLEEGITQLAEEAATPTWTRFAMDHERAREVRRYWQTHGLQRFWWGTAFHIPDEGQAASYTLAQVLFRQLISDYPRQLSEFLHHAAEADAGDLAARKFLRTDLAAIATIFLGAGDWEPVPIDADTLVCCGAYYVEQEEVEKAKLHLDRAIADNPRATDAFFYRAYAWQKQHRWAEAIADYERVLELDPRHLTVTNNLAWILATTHDDSLRNGSRALTLARELCIVTDYANWYFVGTLAAALAETGEFEKAVELTNDGLKLVPDSERAACEARRQAYEAHQPWRVRLDSEGPCS